MADILRVLALPLPWRPVTIAYPILGSLVILLKLRGYLQFLIKPLTILSIQSNEHDSLLGGLC